MGEVLRYGDPAAVDHPLHGRYATITAGAPGRCPSCEQFGFIVGADLVRRLQDQQCRACGTHWSYAFDEDGAITEVHGLPAAEPDVLDLRSTAQDRLAKAIESLSPRR